MESHLGMRKFFSAYAVLCASLRYKVKVIFAPVVCCFDTPIGVFSKQLNLSKLIKSALLILKSTIGTLT